jgi:hypothetical protein
MIAILAYVWLPDGSEFAMKVQLHDAVAASE